MKILIIDPIKPDREATLQAARAAGHEAIMVSDYQDTFSKLQEGPYDLLLLKRNQDGASLHGLLAEIGRQYPELPVVLVGAASPTRGDGAAGHNSIFDFLDKSAGSAGTIAELEKRHITRVLKTAESMEAAARTLGIDPATLYRKRKRMQAEATIPN